MSKWEAVIHSHIKGQSIYWTPMVCQAARWTLESQDEWDAMTVLQGQVLGLLCPWMGLWGIPQLPWALAEQRCGTHSFARCLGDALWEEDRYRLLLQNQFPIHSWGTHNGGAWSLRHLGCLGSHYFLVSLFLISCGVCVCVWIHKWEGFIKLIKKAPGRTHDRKPLCFSCVTQMEHHLCFPCPQSQVAELKLRLPSPQAVSTSLLLLLFILPMTSCPSKLQNVQSWLLMCAGRSMLIESCCFRTFLQKNGTYSLINMGCTWTSA